MVLGGSLAGWVTFAVIGGLPVLLTFVVIVCRLVKVKSGVTTYLVFVFSAALLSWLAAAYLNSLGVETLGEVVEKRGELLYHADGSWQTLQMATVKYKPNDTDAEVTERLDLTEIANDTLHRSSFVKLRTLDSPSRGKFTRFADVSVYAYLWDAILSRPLFFVLILGFFLVSACWLMLGAHHSMLFFMSGLFIIGAWWADEVVAPFWTQTTVRMSSLNTVPGIIREIHPSYAGVGVRAWLHHLLFPTYNIVLVDFAQLGHVEPMTGFDTADEDASLPRPGKVINIQYAATDPSSVILPDLSRSHYWKEAVVKTIFAGIAMILVVIVSLLIREKKPKVQRRRRKQSAPNAPPSKIAS